MRAHPQTHRQTQGPHRRHDGHPQYQLVVTREGSRDQLEIKVELKEDFNLDSINALEELKAKIEHEVHSIIGIKSKITLVEPKSLERFEGKAKRVKDLRKI